MMYIDSGYLVNNIFCGFILCTFSNIVNPSTAIHSHFIVISHYFQPFVMVISLSKIQNSSRQTRVQTSGRRMQTMWTRWSWKDSLTPSNAAYSTNSIRQVTAICRECPLLVFKFLIRFATYMFLCVRFDNCRT